MDKLITAKFLDNYETERKEISRIIGEPKRPDKEMPFFVEKIATFDTAAPNDYVYSFTAATGTEAIYVTTADGKIVQQEVTPNTPTLMSFVDIQSNEFYIKINKLASAKEKAIAVTKVDIARAMDKYECKYVVELMDTAATAQSNLFTLDSGATRFTYSKAVDMIEAVADYGDGLQLICGSQVYKDIILWDYNDNKYQSLKNALSDAGVEVTRVGLKAGARTFNLDDDNSGGATSVDVLAANSAYMVATDTEMGNPILFVRKEVGAIEGFGNLTTESTNVAQRYIFVSGSPVTVTSGNKRYLAVGFTGMEEFAAACVNPYAIAKFTRA